MRPDVLNLRETLRGDAETVILIVRMKVRTLYLETSIFGFWSDETPANREKRESVRMLLRQIRQGRFHGVMSAFVLRELRRWEGSPILARIQELPLDVVEVDPEEVEGIAQEYVRAGVLGPAHVEDTRHVACATVLNVDVLVSLNLRHIANTWRVQGFNAVNLKLGYKALTVATPQEVIDYGP